MSASVTSGSSRPIRERPIRVRMSCSRSAACSPRNGPRSLRERSSSIICSGLVLVDGRDAEDDVVERLGEDAAEAEHDDRPELGVVEEAGDEFPAAGEHRLDQISLQIRPRGCGHLRRRLPDLPVILEIQPDEAPLRLVRQPCPEALQDDGKSDRFRGGHGLLRRGRDRLRHDRHAEPLENLLGLRLGQGGPSFRFRLPDQLRCVHRTFLYVINPVPGHNHTSDLRPGDRAAARRLQNLPVFLVDHPPVELIEFPEHRILLLGAEVVEDRKEEVFVLLLDVTRVKGDEIRQACGDLGERLLPGEIPVLGLDQALDRGAPILMLIDELADDPGMFGAHLLIREIPEEDVLLFAVVCPVGVGPDEIDDCIDEDGIDPPVLADLLILPARDGEHLLDEPVFPHQRSDRFHGVLPYLCFRYETSSS